MISDKDLERLQDALVGTTKNLDEALEDLGLDVDQYDIEQEMMDDVGFGQCPTCGYWTFLDEQEFCVDCQDTLEI